MSEKVITKIRAIIRKEIKGKGQIDFVFENDKEYKMFESDEKTDGFLSLWTYAEIGDAVELSYKEDSIVSVFLIGSKY